MGKKSNPRERRRAWASNPTNTVTMARIAKAMILTLKWPPEVLVINSVINRVAEAGEEALQVVDGIGGGGATRTPHLGIMSLSGGDCGEARRIFKDFNFEEDTLP